MKTPREMLIDKRPRQSQGKTYFRFSCRICHCQWDKGYPGFKDEKENHTTDCPVPSLLALFDAQEKVCQAAKVLSDSCFDTGNQTSGQGYDDDAHIAARKALTELETLKKK